MLTAPRCGDRVRLVSMSDDPDPIAPGQTGAVNQVWLHGSGRDVWCQIDVCWDDGRDLMLVTPPDQFEILAAED